MSSKDLSNFTVIGGFPSNSASPTDVWILKLTSELLDADAPEYVMKLFLSSNTVKKASELIGEPDEDLRNDIENALASIYEFELRDPSYFIGMEYEIAVYNRIKESLIFPKVCTNFVDIITPPSGDGASFEEMLELLLRSAPSMKVSGEDVKANLYESILFMLFDYNGATRNFTIDQDDAVESGEYKMVSNRSMLSELIRILGTGNTDTVDFYFNKFFGPYSDVNASFNFVISEKARESRSLSVDNKKSVLTLRDVLSHRYKHLSKSTLSTGEVASIILQTFCASVAMSAEAGVFHNDLHHDNVFVEIHDTPRTVRYKLVGKDGVTVFDKVLTTRFKVRIFDFDRSYATTLGENPLLDYLLLCGPYHTCNQTGNNLSNVVSISAWLSGCWMQEAAAKGSKIGEFLEETLSRDGANKELAKTDIRTLFKYTCVTNNSLYTTESDLNAGNAFSSYSEPIATEMIKLRAKSSGNQPFFTGPPGRLDIHLNRDIYSWEMFDDVDAILKKLVNAINDNHTPGTIDGAYDLDDSDKDKEFEFNLDLSASF